MAAIIVNISRPAGRDPGNARVHRVLAAIQILVSSKWQPRHRVSARGREPGNRPACQRRRAESRPANRWTPGHRNSLPSPQQTTLASSTRRAVRHLNSDLSLRKAVGFRNVLVHEYADVEDRIVTERLADLSDLREFSEVIARWTLSQSN